MTVKAYRTRKFNTTHENVAFDTLLAGLRETWGSSDERVALLGNFHCLGSEFDAALLKRDAISVIEFKNYGGKIAFSENGAWRADKAQITGGGQPNPYLQVRDYKFKLLRFLKKLESLPQDTEYGHISGLVVFHKAIEFDESQLPGAISPWFHVVDLDRSVQRLSQITSRSINLSVAHIESIIEALGIRAYVPAGAKKTAPAAKSGGGRTFDHASLRDLLVKTARAKKTLTHRKVAARLGVPWSQDTRAALDEALNRIKDENLAAKEPALTTLLLAPESEIFDSLQGSRSHSERRNLIEKLLERTWTFEWPD